MLAGLADKFQKIADSLDEDKILHDIIEKDTLKEGIVELNKKQLLTGKGSDNKDLPKYIDDPFFKTPKAALAYQAWKSKVSPNTEKNPEVMDFYITGQFHNTIRVKNNEDSFEMVSDSDIKDNVESKTNDAALGLNDESLNIVIPVIKDQVINDIKEKISA